MALQISIRECRGVHILDLQGRSTIDTGESKLLGNHLRELTSTGKRKLLLNLVNLSQIDSSGICVIVGMYVSLKRSGGELKLLSPRGRVLDVLTVCRLLTLFRASRMRLRHWRASGREVSPQRLDEVALDYRYRRETCFLWRLRDTLRWCNFRSFLSSPENRAQPPPKYSK